MTTCVKHNRAFIDVAPEQVPLSHLLESRQLPPLASDWSITDSDSDDTHHGDDEMMWDGKFFLSFKDLPADPNVTYQESRGMCRYIE